MLTCGCQTGCNLLKSACRSYCVDWGAGFRLICIHIIRVKPTLKIQFLSLVSYSFASFTFQRSDDGLFFSVARPSNSWFSLPPPPTDLDDISAERRGSLCLNGAFLNFTPPSLCFVSFTGIWFIGGRNIPVKKPGVPEAFIWRRWGDQQSLEEAFLILVWHHGKEKQPEGYVSASHTLGEEKAAFSDENLLQTSQKY